ncbi:MAG: hypothetical protein S4CHLAM37_16860 [Chlamydiia bacterium]|nr:hypothetical protein [Chlamydiia bacterium]
MPEQTPDAARAALETFSSDLGTLAPPKADTGKPITFSELKDLEARVIADGGRKAVNFFKGVKVPEQVETSITTEELETLFSAEDTVDQQTVFPDLEAEIRQLQEQAVTTTAVGFPKPVVPKNPELEAMKESLDARAPVSFFNYLKRSGIINPTVADETRLNGSVTIMHPTGGAIPVMSAAQSSAVNELKQEAAKIVPKTTPNTFMSFLENNPVVRSTKEASVVPPVSTQKAPTTPNTFMSFLKNNPAVPSQPEVPVIPSQAPAAPQVTPPANPANNEVRRVVTEQKDNPIIAIGLTLLTVYAGYKLYKRYTQSDKKEELERYIATLSEVLKDNSALDDAYKIVRNGHISHELFAKKKKAKAFFEATRYMRRNKIKGISYLKSKRAFRSEMIKHLAEKKAELAAVKSRATLTSSLGSVFSKLGNVCGLPRLA